MAISSKQIELTDTETLEEVLCFAENISIETQGSGEPKTLFEILVRAARGDTIENTAKTLQLIPSENDLRYHLNKINNFERLEAQINQALKSRLPLGIKKGRLKVAIDLNLIPYYGKPCPEQLPYIYRSQAKSGTCSFYVYATLYVLHKGKQVTLAIRGVRWQETSVAIITYLLAELDALKVEVKKLYLERGFFSVSVIRWLQALKIPLVMPAIKTGKTAGIKQLLKGRKSYKTTYTMTNQKGDSVTFDLWIICKDKKKKRRKKEVEYLAYVVYNVKISLSYIQQCYRKRFGIESSYRLKNICRIRTTNKRPVLRLLFVGIAFLLVNMWVKLLWFRVGKKRKGGRLIYRKLFTLKQMLGFLNQAIDRKYQVFQSLYLPSD